MVYSIHLECFTTEDYEQDGLYFPFVNGIILVFQQYT